MGQKSKYFLWQLRLCGLLLLTCGSLIITLPDKAEAQSSSTSNSNCMDMGGGMVHCDTMGSNGSMSSSDCLNMGGSMATCNTMRTGQPQTSNPSVDMSRPQTSGVARSIIGDLIIRSQEKSFQKKLSKMLSEGNCKEAYTLALVNQRIELASQIERSCLDESGAAIARSSNTNEMDSVTVFDLLCQGITTTLPGDGVGEALATRFRVDLNSHLYCDGDCTTTQTIASIEPKSIMLSETFNPKSTTNSFKELNRENGHLLEVFQSIDSTTFVEAQCEKQPFSGFPKLKF